MEAMYRTVHEATEKTGNKVSVKEEGSQAEAFVKMLETIEFGVDRDGNPSIPEIHASPEVADKMFKELSSQGPEFEKRIEEIKARKIGEALDKEQERLSKYITNNSE